MRYLPTKKLQAKKLAIVARLNAELTEAIEQDISKFAPVIIEAFRDCPGDVWTSIDDDIGNAARGADTVTRGYLVRSVRNSPHCGRQLFAAFAR